MNHRTRLGLGRGALLAGCLTLSTLSIAQGGTLSEQQAWDVAYYMDAHERPQDPRYQGDLQATMKAHHGGKHDLYGREIDGKVLGAASTPSGGRLSGHNPDKIAAK